METLKSFLEALTRFVPAEFVFSGGMLLVFIIAVLIVAAIVIEAAKKVLVDKVADWLLQDGRLYWIAVLGILLAGALLANRTKSALFIALLAVIVGIIWVVRRKPVAKRYLGMIAIVGVAAIGVEGLFTKLTVYVILPFEPHGENLDHLLSVSKSLRNSMGGVLEDVANVRVEPAGFNVPKDLDDWKEASTATEQLRRKGLEPYVILENLSRLVTDTSSNYEYVTLLLTPSFPRHRRSGEEPAEGASLSYIGRVDDINILGIRVAIDLLAQLRPLANSPVTPEIEQEILHHAAEAYLRQLKEDRVCPDAKNATCIQAEASLKRPKNSIGEIRDLLSLYPADQTSNYEKIVQARKRGFTSKVGSPPPPPTTVGGS